MLSNLRIVLVETSHPGNIGAVARAMKNMGLSNLYLVSPKKFPSAEATVRASGADDILCSARICRTLDEAIDDCSLVIGASARSRTIAWPEMAPDAGAELIVNSLANTHNALLFGRENSGLSNEELDRCHYLLKIPTNPNFSSLNLASAVLVVAYELSRCVEKPRGMAGSEPLYATAGQIESFFQHLYQTLCELKFVHPDRSRSIMRRLRRLFNRTRLEKKEIDILRGVLSAAQGRKNRDREIK